MLEEQVSHPVWLDLSLTDSRLGPGFLCVGDRSGRWNNAKHQDAILTYPKETVSRLNGSTASSELGTVG
jgi:hypothetical protein